MARHTPPSPLGATLAAPPYQACHSPLCLLWGQHAGARCLPTPLPRAPAELGIQEQGLCPGLTGCPAWEEHVQPGLKRAPQAGVTTGGSCGTPLPSGQGSDLWGSGGSSGFIPGFLTLLRFQAHHRHILGRALPKLKGHMVSTAVAPPTGLSHVPPWCESILGLKVEAVQGKHVSLEWTAFATTEYKKPSRTSPFFGCSKHIYVL